MPTAVQATLKSRKSPVQARSTATVEAIFEATVQVLLQSGPERLTTIRVAARAGVSVGTLYQYYPNKQALLFAVLSRHLRLVVEALERACEEHQYRPVGEMIEGVVNAFVDAKLARQDISLALYRIAAGLGADALGADMRKRSTQALTALLRTASEISPSQAEFAAFMLWTTMAGATRAMLESGSPAGMVRRLRQHLVIMGRSYLMSPEIANRTT